MIICLTALTSSKDAGRVNDGCRRNGATRIRKANVRFPSKVEIQTEALQRNTGQVPSAFVRSRLKQQLDNMEEPAVCH